jgi:acetyl-CoA carboxylase carboxyl transferase subunit alpha
LIPEPLGGAHRDYHQAAANLKSVLRKDLAELKQLGIEELLELRYRKFRGIGKFARAEVSQDSEASQISQV